MGGNFKIMKTLNIGELRWAAGFFDGEGTIAFTRTRKPTLRHPHGHRFIALEVPQSGRRETLDRFLSAVGIGKVFGPYNRPPNRKPVFRFAVAKFEHVQAVVALLWRFLSAPKREQAVDALTKYVSDVRHHKSGIQRRFRQ